MYNQSAKGIFCLKFIREGGVQMRKKLNFLPLLLGGWLLTAAPIGGNVEASELVSSDEAAETMLVVKRC